MFIGRMSNFSTFYSFAKSVKEYDMIYGMIKTKKLSERVNNLNI